jgi:hypothetical protein
MMFDFFLLNSKFDTISIIGTFIVLSTLVLEIYRNKNKKSKKVVMEKIRDSLCE